MQERNVDIEVTNVFERNEQSKARTVINAGGAGSSKTYSISQHLIFNRLMAMPNLETCILRRTRTSNKRSVYKDFIKMLMEYDIYDEKDHNKSDLVYTFPKTNSYVWFGGLDQRSRIKSTQWHDIILEEANEFSKEDYWFLKTRLYRGQMQHGFTPRIWMLFNPEDCWIFDLEGKPDVEFIYSNYKDNNFANEEYIKTLEGLKDEDETYYKIYALGQRAKPKGLIYNPYIVDKEFPKEYDDIVFGLDFGYNNPTALIGIGIKDGEYYLNELLYETKLTNADLIERLKQIILPEHRNELIFADDEDPNRIQEIINAGFKNCQPAKKKLVKPGIDMCKRKKFHTLESNVNLNKEAKHYKWKLDKNGEPDEMPVKYKDHTMDALRYGVWGYANLVRVEPYAEEQQDDTLGELFR